LISFVATNPTKPIGERRRGQHGTTALCLTVALRGFAAKFGTWPTHLETGHARGHSSFVLQLEIEAETLYITSKLTCCTDAVDTKIRLESLLFFDVAAKAVDGGPSCCSASRADANSVLSSGGR